MEWSKWKCIPWSETRTPKEFKWGNKNYKNKKWKHRSKCHGDCRCVEGSHIAYACSMFRHISAMLENIRWLVIVSVLDMVLRLSHVQHLIESRLKNLPEARDPYRNTIRFRIRMVRFSQLPLRDLSYYKTNHSSFQKWDQISNSRRHHYNLTSHSIHDWRSHPQ